MSAAWNLVSARVVSRVEGWLESVVSVRRMSEGVIRRRACNAIRDGRDGIKAREAWIWERGLWLALRPVARRLGPGPDCLSGRLAGLRQQQHRDTVQMMRDGPQSPPARLLLTSSSRLGPASQRSRVAPARHRSPRPRTELEHLLRNSWARLSRGRLAGLQAWCSTARMLLQAGKRRGWPPLGSCGASYFREKIGRAAIRGRPVMLTLPSCNGQPCRHQYMYVCRLPPGNALLSGEAASARR